MGGREGHAQFHLNDIKRVNETIETWCITNIHPYVPTVYR